MRGFWHKHKLLTDLTAEDAYKWIGALAHELKDAGARIDTYLASEEPPAFMDPLSSTRGKRVEVELEEIAEGEYKKLVETGKEILKKHIGSHTVTVVASNYKAKRGADLQV